MGWNIFRVLEKGMSLSPSRGKTDTDDGYFWSSSSGLYHSLSRAYDHSKISLTDQNPKVGKLRPPLKTTDVRNGFDNRKTMTPTELTEEPKRLGEKIKYGTIEAYFSRRKYWRGRRLFGQNRH